MQDHRDAANSNTDHSGHPAPGNPNKHTSGTQLPSKADQSNNKEGMGSNYGGTQSGNNTAPDGNQKPVSKSQEGEYTFIMGGAGDEYESRSSYGEDWYDNEDAD